jgi:predicted membrane chloride channel (bestrophin family)
MARRATKEERRFWAQMVIDAREITWKLQNNVPLSDADKQTLEAMPPDVQQSIREVGNTDVGPAR